MKSCTLKSPPGSCFWWTVLWNVRNIPPNIALQTPPAVMLAAGVHATSPESPPTLCDPQTHQAPLSVGFSRQEYWSGFPCLYFHIYCMSGTGDRDRISILKKPQLTEFLIWAGPLEQSGFLNRNWIYPVLLLEGSSWTSSNHIIWEKQNISLSPDLLNLNLHSNKMPRGFLGRLLFLLYRWGNTGSVGIEWLVEGHRVPEA